MPKGTRDFDPPVEIGLELEEPPQTEHPDATLLVEQVPVMISKLSVLESLLSVLTQDLPFQDFMREVLLSIMKAVQSEAGSVLEVDHEKQTIFFRTAVGTASDTVVQYMIPMGQGIVGHVVESREPVVVSNLDESRIHLKAIQRSLSFDARNLVALPIVIRGKVFAVIELLNRVGEKSYSLDDVETLKHLCGYAAKAVELRLMFGWALRQKNKIEQGAA